MGGRGRPGAADDAARVRGIDGVLGHALGAEAAGDDGRAFQRTQPADGDGQAPADRGDREIQSFGIATGGAVQVARQGNARMRPGAGGLDRSDGIDDDALHRRLLVEQGVDERGVGAVLQQAADEVGQQVLVAAHGGVDAQGKRAVALVRGGVERLAHAVQALEFGAQAHLARHQAHGGQRVGVVGGELAVEVRRGRQQGAGAGEVAHVGGGLGGEDRIAGQAGCLGALDLGVPVGALDQPHHEAAAGGAGDAGHGLDHLDPALLVGLDGQTQAAPGAQGLAVQGGLASQAVQKLQREDQPVGLLGVERQVDVGLGGQDGQADEAGIEVAEDAFGLPGFVAGGQRRQLHRDAVSTLGTLAGGVAADGADGLGVGGLVRSASASCAPAQHVERTDEALGCRPAQGLSMVAQDDCSPMMRTAAPRRGG